MKPTRPFKSPSSPTIIASKSLPFNQLFPFLQQTTGRVQYGANRTFSTNGNNNNGKKTHTCEVVVVTSGKGNTSTFQNSFPYCLERQQTSLQ